MPREPLLKKSNHRIGEILVRRGWVSNEALGRALDQQQRPATMRVGEILKASGLVSEEQLAEALAEQYALPYIDLQRLASGWTIDRELYTFKLKHLRILPMRDAAGAQWLLVTEATADEKMMLQDGVGADFSRVKFGVVAPTVLEQVLAENPAANELVQPPIKQTIALPPPGPAGETPPGLARLDVARLLTIVGALWSQSAAELERNAVLTIARGPAFRVAVRQIAVEPSDTLPPGYLSPVTSDAGRQFAVEVTLPLATQEGASAELDWPVVWPPPDLADSVGPLLHERCRVPDALKTSAGSLRWMRSRSPSREVLNRHLIGSAGVSLGHARIDDTDELWDAIRARARGLDANQAARLHWERWKALAAPRLDIAPGHLLAFASLATGSLPRALASTLDLERADGPVFAVELAVSGGRPGLKVSCGQP